MAKLVEQTEAVREAIGDRQTKPSARLQRVVADDQAIGCNRNVARTGRSVDGAIGQEGAAGDQVEIAVVEALKHTVVQKIFRHDEAALVGDGTVVDEGFIRSRRIRIRIGIQHVAGKKDLVGGRDRP